MNASAKDKFSISLNETLMAGPTLQRDLFNILISMRSHRFAFTCDILKMYRMIWMHLDDRKFQSVWWCNSPEESSLQYCLNTVTYDTAHASFLATKCLDIIAKAIERNHPVLAKSIREDFYMDDFAGGADSVHEVINQQKMLHKLLGNYDFQLCQYSTNYIELFKILPEKLQVTNISVQFKNEYAQTAILGVVYVLLFMYIVVFYTYVERFISFFIFCHRRSNSVVWFVVSCFQFLFQVLLLDMLMFKYLFSIKDSKSHFRNS